MGAKNPNERTGETAIQTQAYEARDTKTPDPEALTAFERFAIKGFQRDNADVLEGGNRFGKEVIDAVRFSNAILENPKYSRKESRNCEADFARRILWQYDRAQHAIDAGRADEAATWAIRLGITIGQAEHTLKRSRPGRPKGSLIRGEEQILEVIEEELAAGRPGQPAAREILKFLGIPVETSTLPKDLTRKARLRLKEK